MPKPEIIRYHALAPRADGIQLTRVQTLGVNTDKAREPVSQLGDSGVVQYIEQNPTVSITIDTNGIGFAHNIALLTDALIPRDIGNAATDDPRHYGNAASRYGNTIAATANSSALATVTQADILDAYVDLIVPVTEDGTDITRTCWLHRAALSGMTLTFDVNGNAAENYTLQGNNQTWFLNGWKNANTYVLTDSGIGFLYSGKSQRFFAPHSAIPEGSSVLAVAINENIFYKSRGWKFTLDTVAAGGTAMMAATAGTYFDMTTPSDGSLEFATAVYGWATAGDKVNVIFSRPDDTSYGWTTSGAVTSTAGSLGALARQYIEVYSWNSDVGEHTSLGKSLRVQNLSIEVSPGAEDLYELGNKQSYGVVRVTPIPITVTMTVNDSDLQMWAGFAGLTETNTAQVTLDDFNTNNQLKVKIYKDELRTIQTCEITINDMEVTAANTNVSAGGNSTHEYSFLADNFEYKPLDIDPNS